MLFSCFNVAILSNNVDRSWGSGIKIMKGRGIGHIKDELSTEKGAETYILWKKMSMQQIFLSS